MDLTAQRVKVVALRKERGQLESRLMGQPKEMLAGPLVERYAPCGKPNCRCKKKGAKGHGPYHYVQLKVKGKYTSLYLGKDKRLIELARNYSAYLAKLVELRRMNRRIDSLLVKLNQAKMKKGVK